MMLVGRFGGYGVGRGSDGGLIRRVSPLAEQKMVGKIPPLEGE
jgi:hypothetical protein